MKNFFIAFFLLVGSTLFSQNQEEKFDVFCYLYVISGTDVPMEYEDENIARIELYKDSFSINGSSYEIVNVEIVENEKGKFLFVDGKVRGTKNYLVLLLDFNSDKGSITIPFLDTTIFFQRL